MLDIDTFKAVVPKGLRTNVTPQLIGEVNALLDDPILAENFADNIIGFSSVLAEGKFKMESYLNAVRYVSYKVMGDTNIRAHTKTFPEKHVAWTNKGISPKDISAYVSGFNATKLVTLITKQSLIPSYLVNASKFQDAVNVQCSIMSDIQVSPKVRSDAAHSLMTILKAPEAAELKVDITVKDDSAIADLKMAMRELAEKTVHEVANSSLTVQDVADTPLSTTVADGDE